MRRCLGLALIASLTAGCSASFGNLIGGNGASGSRSDGASAGVLAPTIVIAATGRGGCLASWDGQPVMASEIVERSVVLLERAIEAAGGPQNVTETSLPTPNVEAPADMSFACADTILFSLQRAGVANVRLRPAGSPGPVLIDFPLDTDAPPPPIPMELGLGAGGQLTWNGNPIDAAGLAAELSRIGSTAPSDLGEGGPPPGGMELRVRREATVGQLYELLRTVQRYHLRPVLYLPSAEADPPGAGAAPADRRVANQAG